MSCSFRRVAAGVVAATVVLLCHASGAAAISVDSFSAEPTDLRAGITSDVGVDIQIGDAGDQVRDVTLQLPAGLLGNPNNADRCTEADLQADTCAASSEVGTTTVSANATIPLLGQIPIDSPGTVYNVVAPDDEPARLGIVVRPLGGALGKVILVVKVAVRDEGDYGLTTTISDIPNQLSGISLDITRIQLTLSSSFMVNPTSCVTKASQVRLAGYTGEPGTGTASFRPTRCADVPFGPTLSSLATDARADRATEYTVTLGQPAQIDGRQPSHVSRARIVTPRGVGFNPALAPGLGVCSDAQFGPQGDPDIDCPAASRIAEVELDTPLLGTLPGVVYFGRTAAEPYRLLVVASGSGVTVKLKGVVVPDPDTGQLTTTFEGLPEVPFTRFELAFRGGDTSVLTTPETCGTTTATSTVGAFSGADDATPRGTQEIGGCQTELSPALGVARSTDQAKADTTLNLDLLRPADSGVPKTVRVTLPQGQLAKLPSVPPCPDAALASGACPPESRIGAVTTTVGTGATTVDLPGVAYLAGGTDSAVARVVLVIPVTVGPIELGTFVLPTTLNLDPATSRVVVDASVPEAFNGIPVRLRRLQLSIDREGFAFNPTGCDERAADLAMAGNGLSGSTSTATRATGCEALPFAPTVALTVPDPATRNPGADVGLRVTLANLTDGSALREARVDVPAALRARTDTLVNVCQTEQLAAGACPDAALIGTAYARTPLLTYPLSGPVYIAQTGAVPDQRGGLPLPYAVAMLRGGPVALSVTGALKLGREGRLKSDFAGLPDVPLEEFRLDFVPRLFESQEDLCSTTRGPAPTSLAGHSGAQQAGSVPVTVAACGNRAAVTMSARGLATAKPSGRIRVTSSPVGGPLRAATIRLPRALRPTGRRGKVRVLADGRRLGARAWQITRSGRITVRLPEAGTSRIDVSLRRGSVRTAKATRRRAKRLKRVNTASTLRLNVAAQGTDTVRRRVLRVEFDALVRR